ncbi:MAG: reverse transcriptase domain-containing protein [Bacteroidales bacterium]
MKRVGYLFEQIADVDNLHLAFYKAARRKQDKKDVQFFKDNLEDNIYKMSRDITSGNISIGNYTYFKIFDPKLRTICAASFNERVLHHAIMNICAPYFERQLIETTYATRKNKGIYKAINRARAGLRSYDFVAKFDVRHYFETIDHTILKIKLNKIFKDYNLLELFDNIIDSYSTTPGKGIPIGNLTSQFFANYYLSSFDHWCKEELKAVEYVRYMDDFLFFANTLNELDEAVLLIHQYMKSQLNLTLKPVVKLKRMDGLVFLGYKLYPNKILLARRSKDRFISKSILYEDYRSINRFSEIEYQNHMIPLISFAEKAYSKGLRKRVLKEIDGYGD